MSNNNPQLYESAHFIGTTSKLNWTSLRIQTAQQNNIVGGGVE